MTNKQTVLPEVRSVRAEAGEILAQNGNRLLLIEAILLCLTVTVLYVTLDTAFITGVLPLSEQLGGGDVWYVALLPLLAYGLAVGLVTILFTLPLIIGLFGLAAAMERGEEVALPDLFRPFSAMSRYFSAVRLSFGFFWRIGLTVLAVSATYQLTDRFGEGRIKAALLCAFFIFLEIAAALLLCVRRFSVLFFTWSRQNLSLRQSRRCAAGFCKFAYSAGLRYLLGFLPWIVLSLLTFGILLLADTLPRMLVGYFRYYREIADLPNNRYCTFGKE